MISLVVATKDRPSDLRTLLNSLSAQSSMPAEIIIVDASQEPVQELVQSFRQLTVKYVRHWPPSASAQRNAGIEASNPEHPLIAFVDDDTTFEKHAFEKMRDFWQDAGFDVLGASFNLCNYPERGPARLKHSSLTQRLGLYSRNPGAVSKSGWQTIISKFERTSFVEWLPTGAVVFRRNALVSTRFDEYFEEYSYLEDLDLSYSIGRSGRLAVVAGADYCHFPSKSGRVGMYKFGVFEIRNRLYFVRKHHLSVGRCYLGIAVRSLMTLLAFVSKRKQADFDRFRGNMNGFIQFGLSARKTS